MPTKVRPTKKTKVPALRSWKSRSQTMRAKTWVVSAPQSVALYWGTRSYPISFLGDKRKECELNPHIGRTYANTVPCPSHSPPALSLWPCLEVGCACLPMSASRFGCTEQKTQFAKACSKVMFLICCKCRKKQSGHTMQQPSDPGSVKLPFSCPGVLWFMLARRWLHL